MVDSTDHTDENYLTCPACNAALEGRYVERSGKVHVLVGGVLLEVGTCAKCGKKLFFRASDEPLPGFIARALARRAELDRRARAAIGEVREAAERIEQLDKESNE